MPQGDRAPARRQPPEGLTTTIRRFDPEALPDLDALDRAGELPVLLVADGPRESSPSGRDIVRAVAARQFGVEVDAIEIGADERGKPLLVGDATPFAFNLSDADDVVVAAFALGVDLGVDVEPVGRTTVEPERFARRVLSAAERAALDDAAAHDAGAFQRGLIRWWTRKEAVVKAHGHGLRRELDGIDTSGDVVHFDGREYHVRTVEHDGRYVSVAWTQSATR